MGAAIAPGAAQPPSRQPAPALTYRYAETPGDSARHALLVTVELAPGWHINSDAPLDEFLVPTRLEAGAAGIRFGAPRYPEPERVHSDAVGGDMLLFSGRFDIVVPVLADSARGARKTPPRTRVVLHYQACDHATCFPPKEVAIEH